MTDKKNQHIVTIDGPGGVGKGTISALMANHLKWHLLDSGALYRLTAYASVQNGISVDDISAIALVAKNLNVVFANNMAKHIYLNGQEVTQAIRQEKIGTLASTLATYLEVRNALYDLQRSFIKAPGLIADGRDMGTEIFPEAAYKFFLNATIESRVARRFKQLQEAGVHVNIVDLHAELVARDHRDQTRSVRPLKPAQDAYIIDTSSLSIDAVFNKVLRVVCSSMSDEQTEV